MTKTEAKAYLQELRDSAEEIQEAEQQEALLQNYDCDGDLLLYWAEVRLREAGKLEQQRREVLAVFNLMPDMRLRILLEQRYVQGVLWQDISDGMGIGLRRCFRLHQDALALFAQTYGVYDTQKEKLPKRSVSVV